MELSHLEQIFGALNEAQVRYVVVGGLAVIAHGYVRYTNAWIWSFSLRNPM